ncbi:LytR/AlgR family response regulator transcription factor [Streptococcus caprae]|uniref:LytR/AlgR family response regulator transcription factor n=1 Tax=Streptococcus caprae TaxID=1640501 RepID=A0ABV8CUB5_9STRE
MKIAIVEDQKIEQVRLSSYIKSYCQHKQIPVDITFFNDGIDIASDYDFSFDVIYLDVEMSVLDGMSAAKKIRERDKDVLLVFVTNHSQVAIQGYSVEATDFLLKPLSSFVFTEHFKKILRKLPQKETKSLVIKTKSATYKLLQEDITYIENQGHTIYIHTLKETITTTGTLKAMEGSLPAETFYRSNSCYIVNMAHVEKVDGNISYVAGEALQISRPRKKGFLTALTNYIGDELL